MSSVNRRQFLQQSAAGLGAGLAAAAAGRAVLADDAPAKAPASERLQVGCIGVGGRAAALVHGFASLREVDVVRLCDIDSGRLAGARQALEKRTGIKPVTDGDFRKIIDDPEIDAVVIGT